MTDREALERIAGFTLSQFAGPHDMALECVSVARDALAAQPQAEPSSATVPAYKPVDLNAEDDTYEDDQPADLVSEYTAAYTEWRCEGGSFAACEAAEKKLRAALKAEPSSATVPKEAM